MEYVIRRARVKPELLGLWDGPAWKDAAVAGVASFHPASSDHRPRTRAKLLHDDDALYAMFHVADRFVRCTRTEHQSPTCKDSCVELFVEPKPGRGYLNFELNCGGTMLLYHVTDPTRDETGKFRGVTPVAAELLDAIRVYHSMPRTVEPEITEPVEWTVEYAVPWRVFERHVGTIDSAGSKNWRGNFYKCADESSHPHWASWSPIGEPLNFHVPAHFGELRFEG
jgi:hypothetical protein